MVPDRQKVRMDGRRQNYIPPTSLGDNKYSEQFATVCYGDNMEQQFHISLW